jgi:hypothetical protein
MGGSAASETRTERAGPNESGHYEPSEIVESDDQKTSSMKW